MLLDTAHIHIAHTKKNQWNLTQMDAVDIHCLQHYTFVPVHPLPGGMESSAACPKEAGGEHRFTSWLEVGTAKVVVGGGGEYEIK